MEKMTFEGSNICHFVVATNIYCTTKAEHNRFDFESSNNPSRLQSTEKVDAV